MGLRPRPWPPGSAFRPSPRRRTAARRRRLDRMFGKAVRRPRDAGQDGQEPTTELVLRIERLEAQIRQMTGTIEQLAVPQPAAREPDPRHGRSSGVRPVQPAPGRDATAGTAATGPSGDAGRSAFDAVQPMTPPAPIARPPRRRVRSVAKSQCARRAAPARQPAERAAADRHRRTPPVGAPGGRGAGAPLDLSTLASGAPGVGAPQPGQSPGGGLPPPPSRNLSATGAVAAVAPPSESPKDTYDLGYGYVLRKDYALAEDTFRAFLKQVPDRPPRCRCAILAGRKPVPAPALRCGGASVPRSVDQARQPRQGAGRAAAARAVARAMKQKEMACATLAEVGRKYPRASASVKQGVEREQKRVHC